MDSESYDKLPLAALLNKDSDYGSDCQSDYDDS